MGEAQVSGHRARAYAGRTAPPLPVASLPEAITLDADQLVRDERGVRLAREPEADD